MRSPSPCGQKQRIDSLDIPPITINATGLQPGPDSCVFKSYGIISSNTSSASSQLSYRDLEELLAERGIVVDHVTVYKPTVP
jgi:hypothetical protein